MITRNSLQKLKTTSNWKVYHPNGRHMFTCAEKKAIWYLDRKLAEVIGRGKIKFTFDPKGMGFEEDEIFGRSTRENRCVVSGIETGLQLHHIVPYCYRTYFPDVYKSKNHHDVVLINFSYHSDYERSASIYKNEIAEAYGVKTIDQLNIEYTDHLREIGKKYGTAISSIHSLLRCYNKLSLGDKISRLNFISESTEIPYEILSKYNPIQLYKMLLYLRNLHKKELREFKKDNRMLYDHGYHLMQKLDTEEKIEAFVKAWRRHFIDTMQPKYMPIGWSIDFRIKTRL